MLDFLLLATSKTYWHDHVQALRPQTSSFLDSPPDTSTHACFSLGFNSSNWVDHQSVDNISSFKTLSFVWRKAPLDLTRDLHKTENMSNNTTLKQPRF